MFGGMRVAAHFRRTTRPTLRTVGLLALGEHRAIEAWNTHTSLRRAVWLVWFLVVANPLNAEEEKFEFGTSVKCHVWLGSGETEPESDQLDPPDLVRFVALATTRDWSFQL